MSDAAFRGRAAGEPLAKVAASLSDDSQLVDKYFASQRYEDATLVARTFQHCTFGNLSLKGTRLQSCTFRDCTFVDVYFRKATLELCAFVGCRFIDCQFTDVIVLQSDFRYARFHRCYIEHQSLAGSLPAEHNLRLFLAKELTLAAESVGDLKQSRRFRLEEVAAHEDDLWAAVRGESKWYRDHYPGFRRVRAFSELAGSKVNGAVWGYGERVGVLIRNLLLLAGVIYPLLYSITAQERHAISVSDAVIHSLSATVLAFEVSPVVADTTALRLLSLSEGALSLLLLGLFVTYLFRSITRR